MNHVSDRKMITVSVFHDQSREAVSVSVDTKCCIHERNLSTEVPHRHNSTLRHDNRTEILVDSKVFPRVVDDNVRVKLIDQLSHGGAVVRMNPISCSTNKRSNKRS
jgi:hypothetical protein